MIKNALVLFVKDDIDLNYKINEMDGLLSSLHIRMNKSLVRIEKISKSTYIGSGTLERIKQEIEFNNACNEVYDYLITDFTLTGLQKDNLSEQLDIEVLDKTNVILNVFEKRAKTKEAKLQVEIAKLQYQATQLVNKEANYSQVTSGSGHNKGSGEKEKELNKRVIYQNIHHKKLELSKIKKARKTSRNLRKSNEIPTIAVVGYTNAGKSSLINYLLSKGKNYEDKLLHSEDIVFATLETSTRLISIYGYPSFLLTDTVGFMRDLPHFLINAFRSTLEEIKEADLILHVVDISDQDYKKRIEITNEILEKLDVHDIPKIYLYNKFDLIDYEFPFIPKKDEMFISLMDKEEDSKPLLDFILQNACKDWVKYNLVIPYEENPSSFMFKNLVISRIEKEDGVHITALLNKKYFDYYSKYIVI